MTNYAHEDISDEGNGSGRPFGEAFVPGLIWLAGLLATIYLVGSTSFLVLIALGFADYSGPVSAWQRVMFAGPYAMVLCCIAGLGVVGLKLWPHGRFRFWGLAAILLQVVLAVCAAVRRDGVLLF